MIKTVRNRYGQLTVSLPQLNNGKRLRGYPGVASVAEKLAKLVPECKTYCEHFAGTVKVFQELRKIQPFPSPEVKFNDKSQTIKTWLKKNFPWITVTSRDFKWSFKKWDSSDTFHFFDPPWYPQIYSNEFSVFDRDVNKYYTEIEKLCKKCRGKFMIVGSIKNRILLEMAENNGWYNTVVEGDYVIVNGKSKVRVVTNYPLNTSPEGQ